MADENYHFNVGSFKCTCIKDGALESTADFAFSTAPREQLQKELDNYDLQFSRMRVPLTCLLIDTGTHRVLIDTGLGSGSEPFAGMLLSRLRAEGIMPGDIDAVVLTRGHRDHLGGNKAHNGNPVFNNAKHLICRDEWEYWTSETVLAGQDITWAAFARKNLPPIKDRIEFITREQEVIPGIIAVPAPGHTIGHMAILISSENKQLLTIGDAAGHPIHCIHPEWSIASDAMPNPAITTRRRLFDRAAADHALLHGYHFPFPGIGHIVAKGPAWQWESVDKPV